MSRLLCLDCGNMFDTKTEIKGLVIDKHKYRYCPIFNCNGVNVFECDENMVSIITELNKIGLITSHNCGSHVGADETDIYISFSPDIEAHMLGDIPEGFELEDKDVVFDKVCIRHTIKDHNVPLDLLWQQREINKYIDILTKWVEERRLHFEADEC